MTAARLNIRLLGSFQVSLGDRLATNFESNKVRGLLAYLAVENDQVHRREKLAAMFWPEMPTQQANSNLSRAVYNLRKVIQDLEAEPPHILRSRETVGFNPNSEYWLDLETLEGQLTDKRIPELIFLSEDNSERERFLTAVDLYRGDFLEGVDFDSSLGYDEWVMVVRQRTQRTVLWGMHLLAESCAGAGDIARALSYAWRQVELDPLGEAAYRQLMRLLAASDQRSQALTQFKRLQVLLVEELNVSPEPETIALRDHIRGEVSTSTQEVRRRDNLPACLTPLVGRRAEMGEIQDQCNDPGCRLLTILGPGGSGKTRLALEVAQSSLETFRQGVFFVPLNPVQSPTTILPAIVEAIGLPLGERDDPQAQLINYLRNKDLLLVLDGFEHLLDGAGLIAELLHQAPGFKTLVTSRTRLNIKGEQLFLLGGMRCPETGSSEVEILAADGVQLLISGLRRVVSDYEPAPSDLNHLLQVCHQVQGMPLGILLASSWGGALSVGEIAERVSQSLDFLTADWTDVPERQRSLRATFDYTWDLLGEDEQRVFQSLSVFRGAFTRRAARMVADASPQELRTFVDRSLVWRRTPGWYQVHELLRQFSREKLAQTLKDEKEVLSQHSEYYLNQLVRLGEELKGEKQTAALNSIDLEHENCSAAWNWTAGQGLVVQLLRVLDAFCLYYDLRLRYSDGEYACQKALDGLADVQGYVQLSQLQARLLIWQSRFTRLLGRVDEAFSLLNQVPALLELERMDEKETRYVEASLQFEIGESYVHQDRDAAAGYYQHSLQIYHELENTWGRAKALAGLGFIAHHAGNFQEAVKIYSECLDLHRALGDPRGIAITLINLGQNTLRQGQVEKGERYIKEGTDILEQIGDQAGVARGYFELGRYHFWSGDSERAVHYVDISVPIFKDLGILDQYIFASIGVGLGLSHLGRYAETITRVLKNLPLAEELNARREIGLAYVILGMANLGQGDFEQAQVWAHKCVKQYREINQQAEMSLGLAILDYSHLGLDQPQEAVNYLCETLQIGIEIRGVYPILYVLFAASLHLIRGGEVEKALEISALAEKHPFVGNSCWFEDIAGREIAAAADTLPPEVVRAARERGRERDIWETAAELLEEFAEET